jgi:hypothetical protein
MTEKRAAKMRVTMHTRSGRRRRIALNVALALLALGLAACGDGGAPQGAAPPRTGVESFTFLGMGRETELGDRLRGELAEKLANPAVEHRGTIDLEAGDPGLLDDRLPEIAALHRRLNSPPGERVEHDRTRLMYRYARSKEAPFDLVELVFDPRTHRPLFFRVRFKKDDSGMLAALRDKHGAPAVDAAAGDGRTLVWRKEGDALLVAIVPDQFGNPVHHVVIYFTENLQRRIAAEQPQAAEKTRETQRSGKSPF